MLLVLIGILMVMGLVLAMLPDECGGNRELREYYRSEYVDYRNRTTLVDYHCR